MLFLFISTCRRPVPVVQSQSLHGVGQLLKQMCTDLGNRTDGAETFAPCGRNAAVLPTLLGGGVDGRSTGEGEPQSLINCGTHRSSLEADARAGKDQRSGGKACSIGLPQAPYSGGQFAVEKQQQRRGFTLVERPVDQPWGERVSLVLDPFGIRVRLGQSSD
ncbi:hypothetical protein AB0O34_13475 [Sphaerisporangium sp. NPDC088356]|uniref:hypothetical protein n=1 Tax=Sphaerisporangium sp. NPDC088356 TaxID=3154871 RepID=UPI00341684F6